MPRSVKEWIGDSDDSVPPKSCKLRILDRQDRKCAITGKEFTAKEKPQFDHIVPLWLGGKNRESNLQAILGEPHKRKTKAEATVRGKVKANTAKQLLERKPKGRPFPKPAKEAKPTRRPALPARAMFRRVEA